MDSNFAREKSGEDVAYSGTIENNSMDNSLLCDNYGTYFLIVVFLWNNNNLTRLNRVSSFCNHHVICTFSLNFSWYFFCLFVCLLYYSVIRVLRFSSYTFGSVHKPSKITSKSTKIVLYGSTFLKGSSKVSVPQALLNV